MAARAPSLNQNRTLNRRELSAYIFLVALLIGAIGLGATLFWFSTPQTEYLSIGRLEDFPPSDSPYPISVDDFHAFVVNTGLELIVFDAQTPHIVGVRLKWVPSNHRFEDPATGSKFSLYGEWIDGPAMRNMDRYPYLIRDGQILVERWRTIPGQPRE